MSLNIKNERVHDLAREAARVTGKSQTAAILEALELLLSAYDADPQVLHTRAKVDAVRKVVVEYAGDPGVPNPAVRQLDDLYDEASGLPR